MSQTDFVVAGAMLMMALYLTRRMIRIFLAWADRKEGPQERVAVYLVAYAIIGGIGGGLSHSFYIDVAQCIATTGRAVGDCVFIPSQS